MPNDTTRLDLNPEEYKLIMNHRRLRDKVAHLNKVTKIAKRLDPDAWRDPDAYRTNSSELKTRRDASLAAAEKEIANHG
jgi:predicted  nucleic acid-binding Zn-ribbon protein